MVLDALAAEHGLRFGSHKARAHLAQFRLPPVGGVPGPGLILAKPDGYMNTSGGPVAALVRFFKVDADRLLVVHDELDLPFGQLRLKRDGGEGGHNGLRSVSSALGTRAYCRLRLGIGRPPGRMDPADYVLRDFALLRTRGRPGHGQSGGRRRGRCRPVRLGARPGRRERPRVNPAVVSGGHLTLTTLRYRRERSPRSGPEPHLEDHQ